MRRLVWLVLVVVLMTKSVAYAAGGSIRPTGPVFLGGTSSGLQDLTCFQERVGGYFIQEETFMFYAGDTDAFQAFLDKYAKADDIKEHRLVIHEGKGTSRAPWDNDRGKPCEWMLRVVSGWIELAPDKVTHDDPPAKAPDKEAPLAQPEKQPCVAELTVYTKGHVDVKKLKIPENIIVNRESQTKVK